MSEVTQTSVEPAAAPGAPLDLTGRTLGDYQILRRLGRGGMGEVYLAEQRSLKRNVALKILRGELAANPVAMKRFKQEAEAVARATHANIVQVYDWNEADGITYMALEYVEGRNLKEFIAKKGPPELLLAISLMRQIAAALQRASELGITHRDIKPENILLTRKGEVKVADFGLSRVLVGDQQPLSLTASGVTMGTPLYMAPEQVEGKVVDPRTDIYSFGVTCYHMMTGAPPFTGTNAFEVALAHVRREPEPLSNIRPDLPPAFCAVIHKMMAKDPADRYQTCRELLKDLTKVRESMSGLTTALKSEDLASELLALEPGRTGTLDRPSSEALPRTGEIPKPVPTALIPWRMVLALLVLVSVLLALGGGVGLAWLRHYWVTRPVPNTAGTEQPDTVDAEALLNLQKREQVLREASEQYLAPQNLANKALGGFGVCTDLGLLYLEQNKLDEAERFFTRLDNLKTIESYHVLGHLGRAIVLALRNQSQESNNIFKEVFTGKAPALPAGKAGVRKFDPATQLLQNPQMRYWLMEAVHYNQKGGVLARELPAVLRVFAEPPQVNKAG